MLSTVSVTMGGVDITKSAYVYNSDGYTGGRINIANVTGDINITAEAVDEIVVVNFENCSCSHKKTATDDGSYFGMGYRVLANTNRVSYPRFDLRFPDFDDNINATYTIELDVANEDNYTHNAALQFYSNSSLSLVEKGSQYNDTLDTGWLTATNTTQDSTTNIKTYTFTYSPATHNPSTSGNVMSYAAHRAGKRSNGVNSPIAGMKLTFRRTDNSNWNSTTYTNIKEVRITRTDA